jgi:hypothetical protein
VKGLSLPEAKLVIRQADDARGARLDDFDHGPFMQAELAKPSQLLQFADQLRDANRDAGRGKLQRN